MSRLGWTELALVVILLIGAGLRGWLIGAWRPAFVGYPDSRTYIGVAGLASHGELFFNDFRPAGYPAFLIMMKALSGNLTFTIVVQHLMGLATAVLLYLTVIRFTARRWVALLPAAVVALAGSQIYLEHSVLTESLYAFLLAAALWCAARSLDARPVRREVWLGVAGLLIGLSIPVRAIGLLVAPVFIVWAAITLRSRGPRLIAAGVVILGCALGVGPYLIAQHAETGIWTLTRVDGYTLYGRVASFANCNDFTPPAGTSGLCQAPNATRLDSDWYKFSQGSPSVQLFGSVPNPNPPQWAWPPDAKLGAFALSVISHQPFDYAWTTLKGLADYVDPSFGGPAIIGWSQPELIGGLHDAGIEAITDSSDIPGYYPGQPIVHHGIGALDTYANDARVEGPVTGILLLLMIAGFFASRDRGRLGLGLLGWTTAAMMLAPVLLVFYDTRYATPAYGPLAASAAIGLDQVLERGLVRKLLDRLRPAGRPSPELS